MSALRVILAVLLLACCASGQTCPSWAYGNGPFSPTHWATLCPDWATCGGKAQSPINIANATQDKDLTPMTATYNLNSGHIILNNGYTLKIVINQTQPEGVMELSGGPLAQKFKLYQIHLHAHSEHLFDGSSFDLEVHMVHATNDSLLELAVVGVMFKVADGAAPNPFIQTIDDRAPLIQLPNQQHPIDFDAAEVARLVNNNPYYTYKGSLTTPPCSEIVQWIVIQEVQALSYLQLASLTNVDSMVDNYRPVQAVQNRTVRLYSPPVIIERKGAPIGVVLGIIACGLLCFVVLGITILYTTKVGTSEKESYEDIKTGDDKAVELEDQEVL